MKCHSMPFQRANMDKQELGNGSPKWNGAIINVINYTSTFPTFPITCQRSLSSWLSDNSIILGGCTILTHNYNKYIKLTQLDQQQYFYLLVLSHPTFRGGDVRVGVPDPTDQSWLHGLAPTHCFLTRHKVRLWLALIIFRQYNETWLQLSSTSPVTTANMTQLDQQSLNAFREQNSHDISRDCNGKNLLR